MDLCELFEYKNYLAKELSSNAVIVQKVTGNKDAAVPNHKLIYAQIHPYEYLPDTVSDANTFICFDVDIADVPNKTFYVPVLYIWVFTHKSTLRDPDGGLLLDNLCVEINKMLNGSRFYGLGELKLDSVGRFSPIDDYIGRTLVYTAVDFNRSGQKPMPANRRDRF